MTTHEAIIFSRIAIIALIVFVSTIDLILLLGWGPDATFSRVLRKWGQQWLLLPYLVAWTMGALFGHFFLCPQ